MIAVLAWAAGLVGAASILACTFCAVVFGLGWHRDRRAARARRGQPRIETQPGQPSADLTDCWHIWPDATPWPRKEDTQ